MPADQGNEVQHITVAAAAGTWTATYEADETSALAWNISAADLEDALDALDTLEDTDVEVTGGPGDAGGTTPYVLTFGNTLIGTDVEEITTDASALTQAVVTGATIEESDNVVTKVAHGFEDDDEVVLVSVTGGTGLTEGEHYWVIESGDDTFKLSEEEGGDEVDVTVDATDASFGLAGTAIVTTESPGNPPVSEIVYVDNSNETTGLVASLEVLVGQVPPPGKALVSKAEFYAPDED